MFVLEVLETTLYYESLNKKKKRKENKSLLNQKVVKCLCGLGEEIISNFSIIHTKRTTVILRRTLMFIYPTLVSLPQNWVEALANKRNNKYSENEKKK